MSIASMANNLKKANPIYHNFPVAASYYYKNKLYSFDKDLDYTDDETYYFLIKRQITKQEILPKVKILPNLFTFENLNKSKDYLKQSPNYKYIYNSITIKKKKYQEMQDYAMMYLYDKGYITQNYLKNVFLTKIEFDFYSSCEDKLILSGIMPSLDHYSFYLNNIYRKIMYWNEVFNKGYPLTCFEKTIYNMYLNNKFEKYIQEKKEFVKENNLKVEENIDFNYKDINNNNYNHKYTSKDLIDYWSYNDFKIKILKLTGSINECKYNYVRNYDDDDVNNSIYFNFSKYVNIYYSNNDKFFKFNNNLYYNNVSKNANKFFNINSILYKTNIDNTYLNPKESSCLVNYNTLSNIYNIERHSPYMCNPTLYRQLLYDIPSKYNKIYSIYNTITSNQSKETYQINRIVNSIISQIYSLINSELFQKEFDLKTDFYLNHSVTSVYVWLVYQRLANFIKSKIANEVINLLIKQLNSITKESFNQIDTVRRISKVSKLNETFDNQKNVLNWHFNIYEPSRKNNYFKVDALVWTYVFREKIPRYDDRIYKFSCLIVNEYKRLKYYFDENFEFYLKNNFLNNYVSVNDIKDIENIYNINKFNSNYSIKYLNEFKDKIDLKLEYGIYSIPYNYKEIVLSNNSHLEKEIPEYYAEFSNNYIIKKYMYNYRHSLEKNKQVLRNTLNYENEIKNLLTKNIKEISNREVDEKFDLLFYNKILENKIDFGSTLLSNNEEYKKYSKLLDFGVDLHVDNFKKKYNKLALEEEKKRDNEVKLNLLIAEDHSNQKTEIINNLLLKNDIQNNIGTNKSLKNKKIKSIIKVYNVNSVDYQNSEKLSKNLPQDLKQKLEIYVKKIKEDKKSLDDNYIVLETKIFYPNANIVNKKLKKSIVEKIFKL